jgi:hypothetical protein
LILGYNFCNIRKLGYNIFNIRAYGWYGFSQ